MRWDGDGDDGPGDGDDVDDDPDDAWRDGDDDGGDSPLRGDSPTDFSLPELFFSLSIFRLMEAVEKLILDALVVFRSEGRITSKGSRRGATGAGATRGQGWVRACWPPLLPSARLRAPFWLHDLFPKILSSDFFWNFWSFLKEH